jgi:hypothetical protein
MYEICFGIAPLNWSESNHNLRRLGKKDHKTTLIILLLVVREFLHHIEPPSAGKLRRTLALVLETKLFVIRNHLLMSDKRSLVSNILLRQPIKIGLHDRRAQTFVLELRQNSKRVDGDRATLLLVPYLSIGRVVGGDRHVVIVDGVTVRLGGDDVTQQDGFAVRGATVDRGGGGVCGD